MSVRTLTPSFVLVAALWAATSGAAQAARAPGADAGAAVCSEERRALEEREASLRACVADRNGARERAVRCAEEAATTQRRLQDVSGATQACSEARDALCEAAGGLVQAVLEGRGNLPSLGTCAPAAAVSTLGGVAEGWTRARASLKRLAEFGAGETDALPLTDLPATTEVERLAQKLVGRPRAHAPIVYRRLLVEAVRAMAPRFWKRLRGGGANALDAWFGSTGDLDPALVTEAQGRIAGATSSGSSPGSSLSTALRLVQSFRDVVGCAARPNLRECVRAGKLEELLESSGPLIVRQRIQEIWFTSCERTGPRQTLAWLRDFPGAHLSIGRGEWVEITRAGYDKLVSCWLGDVDASEEPFGRWLAGKLPTPVMLTSGSLDRLDDVRALWRDDGAEASCMRAVRALRRMKTPTSCAVPEATVAQLHAWFQQAGGSPGLDALSLRACDAVARALWRGRRAVVAPAFLSPPSAEELVHVEDAGAPTPTSALRALCRDRAGDRARFPAALARLAPIARLAGEDVTADPWRADAERATPLEADAFEGALTARSWITHLVRGESACGKLDLLPARCAACAARDGEPSYDCALVVEVERRWARWSQGVAIGGGLLAFLLGTSIWLTTFLRAFRAHGPWHRETRAQLEALGLTVPGRGSTFFRPSRFASLRVTLPADASWERWGRSAVVVRAERGEKVSERDVAHAATEARAAASEFALLVHDEGAAPDLAAVRAMLDWAARGPRRAVQILAVSVERLRFITSADDLLDLVEQTSLRGNPFEVRGRLVSSSQFFNRERLVSGLLASAQAGHWTIVTGLRRFGKSSLALEVARRLNGPSAYLDLAGFHHEIASPSSDPARAADGILRYLCLQLGESAQRSMVPAPKLPPPPEPETSLDSPTLSAWLRGFARACRTANQNRPVTLLLVLDEVEQAIGVGPDRIGHAIDVLSILIGRLRACLTDAVLAQGGDRIAVLFCSALHPLLWAPLSTLSQQSLLGAFPSVFVPRLPEDAAYAMMRGLGARQGIRFTDPALALIVREAQGIPILVRRIGSAILELYDPERARQGSLGAVEIGVEGAAAAVRREEEDGAPLRVWVESEIGDWQNPAGVLLRSLARRGTVSVAELKREAAAITERQFEVTGIARLLPHDEVVRRSQEAAGFVVRMLGEIGLLEPEGDLSMPSGYTFPESIVRRILAASRNDSPLGF